MGVLYIVGIIFILFVVFVLYKMNRTNNKSSNEPNNALGLEEIVKPTFESYEIKNQATLEKPKTHGKNAWLNPTDGLGNMKEGVED